jgi:hypothetical protein
MDLGFLLYLVLLQIYFYSFLAFHKSGDMLLLIMDPHVKFKDSMKIICCCSHRDINERCFGISHKFMGWFYHSNSKACPFLRRTHLWVSQCLREWLKGGGCCFDLLSA